MNPDKGWTIILLATQGMAQFVESALRGIRGCGIDPAIVHVVMPKNATKLRKLVGHLGGTPRILEDLIDADEVTPTSYVNYGTPEFNHFMKVRFQIVCTMLDEGRQIVYADIDVAWLRNPLPYLSEVLQHFPWACQTEAEPRFPPNFCVGFFALRNDERCRKLIENHIVRFNRIAENTTMQGLFNDIVGEDPALLRYIFPLPEGLFPNGLLHPLIVSEHLGRMDYVIGRVQPFIFHGNFTIGLENKRRLLRHVRAWWIENDQAPPEQKPHRLEKPG